MYKPTGWLTNSPEIAAEMSAKCANLQEEDPRKHYRHADILSGISKQCEVYPAILCRSILRGLRRQMRKYGNLNERRTRSSMSDEKRAEPA